MTDQRNIKTRARFKEARAAILAVLAEHRIARVEITYDGCGDSGQIEDVAAYDAGDTPVRTAAIPCMISIPSGDDPDRAATHANLDEALDAFAWEIVTALYGAFYDGGDGAYGSFTIHVGHGTVVLEHNERITDSILTYTEL